MDLAITSKCKQIEGMNIQELIGLEQQIGLSIHLSDKERYYLYECIDKRREIIDSTHSVEVEGGDLDDLMSGF